MTTEGNRDISAQEYIGYTNDFGADSFVTLNDEVPLSVGKRRGKQSVIRNKNWLQQHLNEATGSSGIIANIQATENEQLLKEQIDLVNQNASKLLGVHVSDTAAEADRIVDRICGLRVFEDANGKMNVSPADAGAELLIVSQFTLFADCRSRRPGFTAAARPP